MKKAVAIKRGGIAISVLILAGAVLLTGLYFQNSTNRLSDDNATQAKEIKTLQLAISSIQANNGTALARCLDNAATVYANTVKSDSKITVEGVNIVYTQSEESWKAVNDKLNIDRESCNKQYH